MNKRNKPIIGIIACNYQEKNRPFNCYTKFVNNYTKRIIQSGGIPIGILNKYGRDLDNVMDLCDGFIINGGSIITNDLLNKIDYIIKSGKPLIGICLGMQALVAYDYIKKNNYKIYNKTLEKYFLTKVKNHNRVNPFYLNSINNSRHLVNIEKNSKIYKIIQNDLIEVSSLHNYQVKENSFNNSMFKIVGKSEDGVIEVIESKNNSFLIGVQFHPELDDKYLILFKEFIKECKKNKA